MTSRSPIDQSLVELRAVDDPYARLWEAERLDGALVYARSAVAQIKRDAINELRAANSGYGRIAQRLRLTKTRVQQIANTTGRLGPVVFAVRGEDGAWRGDPDLPLRAASHEAVTLRPFEPPDEFNPLFGHTLTVRYGEVTDDDLVTVYSIRIVDGDGREVNLRMTHRVQDALFGPADMGSKERATWEAQREQQRRSAPEKGPTR